MSHAGPPPPSASGSGSTASSTPVAPGRHPVPTASKLDDLPQTLGKGGTAALNTTIGKAGYKQQTNMKLSDFSEYSQAFMQTAGTGSPKTKWTDMAAVADKPGGITTASRALKTLAGHSPKGGDSFPALELDGKTEAEQKSLTDERSEHKGRMTNMALTTQAEEYTGRLAGGVEGTGSALRAAMMKRKYDALNGDGPAGTTYSALEAAAPQIKAGGVGALADAAGTDGAAAAVAARDEALAGYSQSVGKRFDTKFAAFSALDGADKVSQAREQLGDFWAGHAEAGTSPTSEGYLAHKNRKHGIKPPTSPDSAREAAVAAHSDDGAFGAGAAFGGGSAFDGGGSAFGASSFGGAFGGGDDSDAASGPMTGKRGRAGGAGKGGGRAGRGGGRKPFSRTTFPASPDSAREAAAAAHSDDGAFGAGAAFGGGSAFDGGGSMAGKRRLEGATSSTSKRGRAGGVSKGGGRAGKGGGRGGGGKPFRGGRGGGSGGTHG